MTDAEVKWVATLSDGTTAVEHTGEYQIVQGQRKPWVRLCSYLAENDLHLTSLRLNFKGRTIHLPRSNFGRFGYNEYSRTPLFYSLSYHLEGEMGPDQVLEQTHFIDLVAHFESYEVHYIQDLENGNNSWLVVTENTTPLAATPWHGKHS